MAEPLIKSIKHTPPPESASIEEALLIQATEAAHAIVDELNYAARYGKIGHYPSATNLQGVRMQDENWTLAVIVVAYPDAQADGAGDFIKAAFEGTLAEHRKSREIQNAENSDEGSVK